MCAKMHLLHTLAQNHKVQFLFLLKQHLANVAQAGLVPTIFPSGSRELVPQASTSTPCTYTALNRSFSHSPTLSAYLCICLYLSVNAGTHVPRYMYRGQRTTFQLYPSPFLVGAGAEAQVVRLSYLTGPSLVFREGE